MSDPAAQPVPPHASDPAYLAPYREAVAKFGPSFQATLWASREWQLVRFRVMTRMVDFSKRVILDAGAGQGALASYLRDHRIRYRKYIALEAIPEMAESGRAARLPRTEFHVVDFAAAADAFSRFAAEEPVDVIVFSGSLNTFTQEGAMEALGRAWGTCSYALLFNFLSSRHDRSRLSDEPGGPSRRFDPLAMLDWALSKTTAVRLRHDYFRHGHDATIGMFKK